MTAPHKTKAPESLPWWERWGPPPESEAALQRRARALGFELCRTPNGFWCLEPLGYLRIAYPSLWHVADLLRCASGTSR